METKVAPDPVDGRIAELAVRQYGVVAHRQLEALGLGRPAIKTRVGNGRLHRVHKGVYAVGYPRLTRDGRFMAAVLACGDGAVASHAAAAVLWALRPWKPAAVDVTVPGRGGRRRRRGIVVHRSALEASEVTTLDGIPVTTPARTLVDLADVVPRRALERAIDEAEYLRLDCTGLAPRHGRRGSGLLARVLADHLPRSTRTHPGLEDRFVALCTEHRLALPETNVYVEGYEVDFLWRRERLIVETDGRGAHMTRSAFERDRMRDAELLTAGYRVMRLTDARLVREPDAVMAQIVALLRRQPRAARGAAGRS